MKAASIINFKGGVGNETLSTEGFNIPQFGETEANSRKYKIPDFLVQKLTQANYQRWLVRKAAAPVKRRVGIEGAAHLFSHGDDEHAIAPRGTP